MTDILLHGCNGRMGQMIAGLLENDADARIVAGVDAYTGRENPFPVFSKIEADVYKRQTGRRLSAGRSRIS